MPRAVRTPRRLTAQLALRRGLVNKAQAAFRDALEQYPASARAEAGLRDAAKRASKAVEAGQ